MSRKPEKRALLVGINAYSDGALNGCVNDVIRINQVITNHFGFTDSKNKRMLTDKSATTKNILDRLTWLVPSQVTFYTSTIVGMAARW